MRKIFVLFLLLAMLLGAGEAIAAMTEVDGGYVSTGGTAYKLYRGVFNFPSEVAIGGAMKDIPAMFLFR